MFNPGDIVYTNFSENPEEQFIVVSKVDAVGLYLVKNLRQEHYYAYEESLMTNPPLKPYTTSQDSLAFIPKQYAANQKEHKKPDGGPADYYDIPYKAHTLNDLLEYKGEYHWKGDSFHLANLVKAAWRWGVKQGTTEAYDARKFIYSGARLLMKYAGVKELRETLQRMLDDPQFKEDDK